MTKNKILVSMVLGFTAASGTAAADGFICNTDNRDLNIKVYNYTKPSQGTRRAAVMVMSDPSVQEGSKTIARFTHVNSTLSNSGATYVAEVEPESRDAHRKGEYLVGTRLGAVDTIVMDLAFTYGHSYTEGESIDGTLSINKRDGKHITRQVECSRYRKHQ